MAILLILITINMETPIIHLDPDKVGIRTIGTSRTNGAVPTTITRTIMVPLTLINLTIITMGLILLPKVIHHTQIKVLTVIVKDLLPIQVLTLITTIKTTEAIQTAINLLHQLLQLLNLVPEVLHLQEHQQDLYQLTQDILLRQLVQIKIHHMVNHQHNQINMLNKRTSIKIHHMTKGIKEHLHQTTTSHLHNTISIIQDIKVGSLYLLHMFLLKAHIVLMALLLITLHNKIQINIQDMIVNIEMTTTRVHHQGTNLLLNVLISQTRTKTTCHHIKEILPLEIPHLQTSMKINIEIQFMLHINPHSSHQVNNNLLIEIQLVKPSSKILNYNKEVVVKEE